MVPSTYVRDRILTRYLPLVTEALQDIGEGQRRVEIDVEAADSSAEHTDAEARPTDEPEIGYDSGRPVANQPADRHLANRRPARPADRCCST